MIFGFFGIFSLNILRCLLNGTKANADSYLHTHFCGFENFALKIFLSQICVYLSDRMLNFNKSAIFIPFFEKKNYNWSRNVTRRTPTCPVKIQRTGNKECIIFQHIFDLLSTKLDYYIYIFAYPVS